METVITAPYDGAIKHVNLQQIYDGGVFQQKTGEYTTLLNRFENFLIPWKNDFYVTPILSLFPGKSAKFSLKIEVEEEPDELKFVYDKSLFQLNKDEISQKAKGKHTLPDFVTVKCLKSFDKGSHQYIKVMAITTDESGNKEEKVAGQLKVLENKTTFKTKIVFVNVRTMIDGTNIHDWTNGIGGSLNLSQAQTTLDNYLWQSLIKAEYQKATLNLVGDNHFNTTYTSTNAMNPINGIHGYLEQEFLKQNPPETGTDYNDYFKVYFINEDSGTLYGHAEDIPSMNTIVYGIGFSDTTAPHELLHSMGLYHSFDNDGNSTFEQNETDNIMDYSDIGPKQIPVITTWHWQWKTLTNNNQVKSVENENTPTAPNTQPVLGN